jgi:hypothetical protein
MGRCVNSLFVLFVEQAKDNCGSLRPLKKTRGLSG